VGKILLWMAAGVLAGVGIQLAFQAVPFAGWTAGQGSGGGIELTAVAPGSPAERAGLHAGDRIAAVALSTGPWEELGGDPARLGRWVGGQENGQFLRLRLGNGREVGLTLAIDPESARARALAPFSLAATLFLRFLQMLIVPLILTSIVTGVTGVAGGREFGRLGAKTLGYYLGTSLLAIGTGLTVVNLFQPGRGARLGLRIPEAFHPGAGQSLGDVLAGMVPANIFQALAGNSTMLQVIVFSLIFGFFISRTPEPHGLRIRALFESGFEVMMRVAVFVLGLIPYGVFALMVKVVGETGLQVFRPLFLFMLIVICCLAVHALVTLPLLLRLLGRINPRKWAAAMSPALLTAFTTSSSSITLPVSMECAEKRGGVSNKTSSFVLPLGATINMDGTALYECVGVIFLSQYYASHSPLFHLTLGMQVFVVLMALLASIGAAGIPSAGLVLKAMILKSLGLPDDGVLLLLAVDRPLDMMRTAVNVWSDSCGAALIARSEGEAVLAALPAGPSGNLT